MTSYVLDASALLALLREEPGAATVWSCLPGARISSINWSEVIQKVVSYRLDPTDLLDQMDALDAEILGFDRVDAEMAAALHSVTKSHGLSLADRACLALAKKTGSVALTADQAWRSLHADVRVKLIR